MMKRGLSILAAMMIALPCLAEGESQPNVFTRAVGWTASAIVDNLISKPISIIGDIVKVGGNIANGRYQVLTFSKDADGFHFALIDIDPRSIEQREADRAESNYEPEYEDTE